MGQESDAGFNILCSLLFQFSSELCFVCYLRLSSIRLSSSSLLYFQKYVKNKTQKKVKFKIFFFFESSKLVFALVFRIDSSKKFGFELVDNMRYISSTKYESGIFKYYASWGTVSTENRNNSDRACQL